MNGDGERNVREEGRDEAKREIADCIALEGSKAPKNRLKARNIARGMGVGERRVWGNCCHTTIFLAYALVANCSKAAPIYPQTKTGGGGIHH